MAVNGTSRKPLNIGIMAEAVQLMDISCIDCLGTVSEEAAVATSELGSEPFIPESTPMTFHWISSDLNPSMTTSGLKLQPTITYDGCPRDLDILLIGGPLPSHRPEAADRFMREAFAKTKVVMTTCVGSWWLASSGVLDGHKCTVNRGALDICKKMYPKTEWLDQRWVVDKKEGGELWTGGGADAGIDMVAAYVRKNFPPGFAAWAMEGLDVNEKVRGQFY